MTNPDTLYIAIGKIGSTYGVQGWLKVRTYTEYGGNVLDYTPWYLSASGTDNWREVTIQEGRVQSNTILVKFAGIDTPEDARLLTGQTIAITRNQLPALNPNEYYWSDLIGLTVINKTGAIYGKVAYLIETGSNDVLVVKGDKEHAIPFLLNKVVLKIDLEKREILVDWELI